MALGFVLCLYLGHWPWRITKAVLGACGIGLAMLCAGSAGKLGGEGQHEAALVLIGLMGVIISASLWLNYRGGQPK